MELPAEVVDSLLHAASEAAVVTDGSGVIVFVNSEAESLFGYSADEMVGQPVEILIPREHRAHHERHRRNYEESPRSRPLMSGLELWGCRKDGTRQVAERADREPGTLAHGDDEPAQFAARHQPPGCRRGHARRGRSRDAHGHGPRRLTVDAPSG